MAGRAFPGEGERLCDLHSYQPLYAHRETLLTPFICANRSWQGESTPCQAWLALLEVNFNP